MNRSDVEHRVSERLSFRSYISTDEEAALRLLNISLGNLGGQRTVEYWRWKHLLNPFGESAIRVAHSPAGEMVALRAFLRWRFNLVERSFSAFRCVDTAVHPEYRGRGLFTAMTLGLIDELYSGEPAVIFNTPNRQSLPGYLKMGWAMAGKTQLMVWPQPGQWLWSRFRKLPSIPDLTFDLPSSIQRHISDYADVHRSEVTSSLSVEYLQWRYGQIPGIRYGVATESGDGFAIAIWRLKSTRGLRELRLVELFHDYTGAAVHRLIRRLTRELHPEVVTVVVDGAGILKSLLPSGFLPAAPFGLSLTLKNLNDPDLYQSFSDPIRRNLSGGTLELF